MDVYGPYDPVFAAWLVVDTGSFNVDIGRTKALRRLSHDLLFANARGFLHPESMAVATIVIGVARVGTVSVFVSVAISIVTAISVVAVSVLRAVARLIRVVPVARLIRIASVIAIYRRIVAHAGVVVSATARVPNHIERIPLGAALFVFDLNNSYSALSRVTDQSLASPAIYALESEVCRVCRHDAGTLETPPLGRLPGEVPYGGIRAAYFDLSDAIDHYFDGAFAAVGTAPSCDVGLPLKILSAGDGGNRNAYEEHVWNTYFHLFTLTTTEHFGCQNVRF